MNKAVRIGNVSRALKQGAADCNLNRDTILVTGLSERDMEDSQGNPIRVDLNDTNYTPICDWIKCDYKCKPAVDFAGLREDTSTYDLYAARFAEQSLIARLKSYFAEQVWYRWADIKKLFADIPEQTLVSILMRAVNNPSVILKNNGEEGHLVYRNNLFLFQPVSIRDEAIPLALRYGIYSTKRHSYEPKGITGIPEKAVLGKLVKVAKKVVAGPAAAVEEEGGPVSGNGGPVSGSGPVSGNDSPVEELELVKGEAAVSLDAVIKFWIESNKWIDAWANDAAGEINESIPEPLASAILAYVERDYDKKDNIETRMKKFQWWGKAVMSQANGLADLRKASRQYIWDSFLKGKEQVALLTLKLQGDKGDGAQNIPYIDEVKDEQVLTNGISTAVRYVDLPRKSAVYICDDNKECSPAIVKSFAERDTVINTKANQRTAAEIYGFMVPFSKIMMFKTNEPKPEGKAPGGGAACAIVSTVKGHRMKLVILGQILNRYMGANLDLTEEILTGTRKLTGAPSFCALLEIVLRWMDIRRAEYGGLRFFFRPLASYYSGHKGRD